MPRWGSQLGLDEALAWGSAKNMKNHMDSSGNSMKFLGCCQVGRKKHEELKNKNRYF